MMKYALILAVFVSGLAFAQESDTVSPTPTPAASPTDEVSPANPGPQDTEGAGSIAKPTPEQKKHVKAAAKKAKKKHGAKSSTGKKKKKLKKKPVARK